MTVYKLGTELGVKVVRGEEDDVLARYAKASKETEANILIRITGDCPLVDALLLDEAIKEFVDKKVDYLSNLIHQLTLMVLILRYLKESYCWHQIKNVRIAISESM